jgi:DeoR/GlpR family transcriptional regulator of sugar metabolism
MMTEERLERIVTYLRQHKYASFAELIDLFQVSKSTIRRDLERLQLDKQITLIRGGAIAQDRGSFLELPYNEKLSENREEKSRIARAAAGMIKPHSTVIIDSGTTARELAPFLVGMRNIHVITNDIALAADLTTAAHLEVTVIGGRLRNGYYSLEGYFAEKMIKEIRADLTLATIDTISVRYGCMVANIAEVNCKKAFVDAADQVILLCDHTKFNKSSLVSVYPLKRVDLYISGKEMDSRTESTMRELGMNLMLV